MFKDFLKQTAEYLANNQYCRKHKIEHTGKNIYAVDFYFYLGELEKAKKLILNTIKKITRDGKHWIFYPGRLSPYNKSNNVVDCGAIVDSVSNFLKENKDIFTKDELAKIEDSLGKVVYGYLAKAAVYKPVTNQRLWGLTGLASYYNYSGDSQLLLLIKKSVEISLKEMTDDGFFIYYPKAQENGCFGGYSGLTTYYQSRCTAFLYYVIEKANLDLNIYRAKLGKSIEALLAMYKEEGYKDLNLECKRWYWLNKYEVASNSFDIYALSKSNDPLTKGVLNNSLFQVKNHFYNGYLHSNKRINLNFQCHLFWNAHLAWLIRTDNIEGLWNKTNGLKEINFNVRLDKVINVSGRNYQIILSNFWQPRDFTAGLLNNGLPDSVNKRLFKFKFVYPSRHILKPIKENLYHIKVAFRTANFIEGLYRFFCMFKEIFISFLPVYQLEYGKIGNFNWQDKELELEVAPATKFGFLLKDVVYRIKFIFNKDDYRVIINK